MTGRGEMIDRELADNYRRLRVERGWTWEQLAEHLAPSDPKLAAWCRSQVQPDRPRRGKGQQETR